MNYQPGFYHPRIHDIVLSMTEPGLKNKRLTNILIHIFLVLLAPVYLLKVIPISQIYQGVLPGDNMLNLWALTWQWRTILTKPFELWNGNAFYPFKQSIIGSDHLFTQVVNGLPVFLITHNPFLTYHFVLYCGYIFGAWGMFKLTKYLFSDNISALAAAVFYTVALPRTVHAAAHLQLAYMAWLPWSVYFLHRIYQKSSPRLVAGLIITSVLQILSGWYLAVYHGIILTVVTVALSTRYRRKEPFIAVIISAAVCLLIILPFALPYLGREPVTRDVWEQYAANPGDYYMPASFTVYSLFDSNQAMWSESTVWMGYIAPLMILLTIFIRRKTGDADHSSVSFAYLILILLGIALSCGMNLPYLDNNYAPWSLLSRLPAVSGMRVPARSVLIVIFAVAVLFARSIRVITQRFRNTGNIRVAGLLIIGMVMLENLPLIPIEASIAPEPAVYKWLKTQPETVSVAEVPSLYGTDLWAFSANYMMFAALHGHCIANGYSRYVPDGFPEVSATINSLPSESSVRKLKNMGIDYVILHPQMYFQESMHKMISEMATGPNSIGVFNSIISMTNVNYEPLTSSDGQAQEKKFLESPYLDLVSRFDRDLLFKLKN